MSDYVYIVNIHVLYKNDTISIIFIIKMEINL